MKAFIRTQYGEVLHWKEIEKPIPKKRATYSSPFIYVTVVGNTKNID